MSKKTIAIFNPDFEIYGSYDQVELERAERAERGRSEFDAEMDCPYDRMLCRQKMVRIINWQQAVEYMALNRVNNVFCTSADMFYGCPVPDLHCVRRMRYEAILNRFKEHQK